MTNRQVIRLGIVFAVIVAVWGALALIRRHSQDTEIALVLPRVDSAAIASLRLTQGADTAVFTRGGRGRWLVNGYPSDSSATLGLIAALADTTAQTELVAQSVASHRELGIDSAAGLQIVVTGTGGTPLLDVTTGVRTPNGTIHVRRTQDSAVFALRGRLLGPLSRSVTDWRDKRIAIVPSDSVAVIEVERPSGGYRLMRAPNDTTGAWTIDGHPADRGVVQLVLDEFRTFLAASFATPVQMDSASFRPGGRHIRILSRAGAPMLSIKIDSTAGSIWVRADSGGAVFRLDAWDMYRMAPPVSAFTPKR